MLASTDSSEAEFAELPATAQHDALTLEYRWLNRDCASANLAVFLHEGLGSVAMWKDWPQQLCDTLGCRGLVYSRPGYGRSTPRAASDKWPVDFMHRQAREVLPALLDTLDIGADERRRMWLIGHSDGGSIALLYAAAFPDALAGAAVLAPHVMAEDVAVASIAQARVAYEQTGLRERLARYHDDVESAFWGWNDIWLDPAFRAWNIEAELAAIRCPLLGIQGYGDEYGTMAQMDLIARHVSHARIVKLEDCGHSPHRDAPAAVNDAIARFVTDSTQLRRTLR
jgi:pimeloyl-ACP methyl ester carboxylesterase